MTANPNPTLGREKSHKCFKICDEDCSCGPLYLKLSPEKVMGVCGAWAARRKK